MAAYGESGFFGRHYHAPEGPDGGYTADQLAFLRENQKIGGCLLSVAGEGPGCLRHLTLEQWTAHVDAVFDRLEPGATPADVFRGMASAIAAAEGKTITVEKTPHHLNWIDRILAHLPEARFVVMLRDPYGFLLSYKHIGDHRAEAIRRRFRNRYHPLAGAIVWRGSQRSADAAARLGDDRVLLVTQEDVSHRSSEVLDRVQRFFGLAVHDLSNAVPPDNTSFVRGARPELRSDDIFWMNLIAGRDLAAAGYERGPVGGGLGRIAWSVIRLPWWAVHNLVVMRRFVRGSVAGYLLRWVRGQRPAATEASS